MELEDICALPVGKIADKNCILFLWGTWPKLKEALKVIEAWGFEYKTNAFLWAKLNPSGWGSFVGLVTGQGKIRSLYYWQQKATPKD